MASSAKERKQPTMVQSTSWCCQGSKLVVASRVIGTQGHWDWSVLRTSSPVWLLSHQDCCLQPTVLMTSLSGRLSNGRRRDRIMAASQPGTEIEYLGWMSSQGHVFLMLLKIYGCWMIIELGMVDWFGIERDRVLAQCLHDMLVFVLNFIWLHNC